MYDVINVYGVAFWRYCIFVVCIIRAISLRDLSSYADIVFIHHVESESHLRNIYSNGAKQKVTTHTFVCVGCLINIIVIIPYIYTRIYPFNVGFVHYSRKVYLCLWCGGYVAKQQQLARGFTFSAMWLRHRSICHRSVVGLCRYLIVCFLLYSTVLIIYYICIYCL